MSSPEPEVRLRRVDEDVLEELVAAATTGALASEVTPPVTPGEEWTPGRVDWLRNFHRTRQSDLDAAEAEMSWAVVADERVVGAVRLKRVAGAPSAEVGLWLTRSARGRGIGRRAVTAVLAEAADRGLTAVRADTAVGNRGALALLAALGFEPSPADGDTVIAWRVLDDPTG